MIVLILADTHGVLDDRIQGLARDSDLVVHAGDVGNADVLDALSTRTGRVVAIRGNNDTPGKWPPAHHDRLGALPEVRTVSLPGGDLVVVHGDRSGRPVIRHRRLRETYACARAVVYGHSHRSCIDRESRPWVLNPGAAGRARTYGGPSCLVLEATSAAWEVRLHRFEPAPRAGRRRR